MAYPFATLQPEYAHLLSVAKITRPGPVHAGVAEIMKVIDSYVATSAATKIPAAWIGPTDCREDDCNPNAGIGQGDPWRQVSRHVPAGHGPFASKAAADQFYLHYDHIDVLEPGVSAWTLPYACYCWERWNGFGPRAYGRISGYLFSCMDVYDTPAYGGYGKGGKYVADKRWSSTAVDVQPGAVPLYLELIKIRPDLTISAIPVIAGATVPLVPAAPPVGVHDAAALQAVLNMLGADPQLEVDNNYGRKTIRTVRAFQELVGIGVDGIAGDETWAAINEKLKAIGAPVS